MTSRSFTLFYFVFMLRSRIPMRRNERNAERIFCFEKEKGEKIYKRRKSDGKFLLFDRTWNYQSKRMCTNLTKLSTLSLLTDANKRWREHCRMTSETQSESISNPETLNVSHVSLKFINRFFIAQITFMSIVGDCFCSPLVQKNFVAQAFLASMPSSSSHYVMTLRTHFLRDS